MYSHNAQTSSLLPVSEMAFVGIMLSGVLENAEAHYEFLQAALINPGHCNDDLIKRTKEIFTARQEHIKFCRQQLELWHTQIDESEKQALDELHNKIARLNNLNLVVLAMVQSTRKVA